MIKSYYVEAVCANGHVIQRNLEPNERPHKFCKKCSASVLYECQNCGAQIDGDLIGGMLVIGYDKPAPAYCGECGNPYPWTEKKILLLQKTLELEADCSKEDVNEFIKMVPDIISETPGTKFASLLYRKLFSLAGEIGKSALVDFVKALACEAFRDLIG